MVGSTDSSTATAAKPAAKRTSHSCGGTSPRARLHICSPVAGRERSPSSPIARSCALVADGALGDLSPAQHAEGPTQLDQRLPAGLLRRAQAVALSPVVAWTFQTHPCVADLHDHQADRVGDRVVHVSGDAGPLAFGGPLLPPHLLTLEVGVRRRQLALLLGEASQHGPDQPRDQRDGHRQQRVADQVSVLAGVQDHAHPHDQPAHPAPARGPTGRVAGRRVGDQQDRQEVAHEERRVRDEE